MSTFRDSSPTSNSKIIQASTAGQSQKTPQSSFAFSNRVSLNDGGQNEALAAASFAGTEKKGAVRTLGKAKQTFDKPLIDP
jgi:hypothetical protein